MTSKNCQKPGVLLHGAANSRNTWESLESAVTARGWRRVRLDEAWHIANDESAPVVRVEFGGCNCISHGPDVNGCTCSSKTVTVSCINRESLPKHLGKPDFSWRYHRWSGFHRQDVSRADVSTDGVDLNGDRVMDLVQAVLGQI